MESFLVRGSLCIVSIELQVESQKNLATHLLLTYYSLGTLEILLDDLSAWGAGPSIGWDVASKQLPGRSRQAIEPWMAGQVIPGTTLAQNP